MMRTVVVAVTLLLGVGAVVAQQDIAVQQDNLMRAQGKSMYGVILKTTKGEIPYDQKAIADVKGKITDVASLKVAYDSIQAKCADCHDTYRLKLK